MRTGLPQRALSRQYDALSALQNYTVVSRNPYDRLTDIDAPLSAGNKIGGASLRVKWNLGGGTLTSISAWRFWDWKPRNDRDFTGLSIVSASNNPSQQNQYSQEFRYNYSADKFDFVVVLADETLDREAGDDLLRPFEVQAIDQKAVRAAAPDHEEAGDLVQRDEFGRPQRFEFEIRKLGEDDEVLDRVSPCAVRYLGARDLLIIEGHGLEFEVFVADLGRDIAAAGLVGRAVRRSHAH